MTLEDDIKKKSDYLPSPYVSVKTIGELDNSPNELVLKSDTNAHIVLGGSPQNTPEIAKAAYNSTITLISGVGTSIKSRPPPPDKRMVFSNKFYYDSAVIQISEQTNVDDNFGSRNIDPRAQNKSAIALKADEIRLFSRGSVKIVTNIDQMEKDTILKGDKDAPTQPQREYAGISLIAGNSAETDGELHPLVLGRNLEEFLNKVLDEINKLYATIYDLFEAQGQINNSIRDHTHLSDFTGAPLVQWTDSALVTTIEEKQFDINAITKLDTNTKKVPNIESLRKNYLVKNPRKYINSYFNKTN